MMIERREMAEIYGRSEMGFMERERVVNPRLCEQHRSSDDFYEIRGNAEGFRTLSHSHDHDLSIRDSVASRFQRNSLGDSECSGFVSRERNYDVPVETPLPIVSERARNVRTYDHDSSGSEYFGQSIEVGRFNTIREREYPLRLESESLRQRYDDINGRGLRSSHDGGSHSSTPRSQGGGQRTPFPGAGTEGLPLEVQYSSVDGIPSSRSSSYHCIPPYSDAGRTSHCFSVDGGSSREEHTHAPNASRLDDYIHPASERSRNFPRNIASLDVYDDLEGNFGIDAMNGTLPRHHNIGYSRRDIAIKDEYSSPQNINHPSQEAPRHRNVGYSRIDVAIKDEYSPPQNISHPSQEAPILDNYGGNKIDYETVYGVGEVNLGSRNSYLDHSIADIHGTSPREQRFSYERNDGGVIYEREYINSPRMIERVSLIDPNTRQILETRDFVLPEQSNTARKRRLEFVDQLSDAKLSDTKRRTIGIADGSSYGNRLLTVGGEEELGFSNKSRHLPSESHLAGHTIMFDGEARQPSAEFYKSLHKPVGEHQESGRGDVKKRLTFPHAVSRTKSCLLPWKQEARSKNKHFLDGNHPASLKAYGKAKGADFTKKLKSVPKSVVCSSVAPDHSIHSCHDKNQQQKLPNKDLGSTNDPPRRVNVDPGQSVLKVKPLPDLREDSEKFNQSVDEWFLKCMAHLNGNIDSQKRFCGNEIGGKLKCIICSSYKEFIETKDVAMHAFTSTKVGYRAQHLGFHRALCVLMGWDIAVASNGRWVCKPLPELDAWTLKEDVIIWPPVVIIHHYPARNCQLNEPENVSTKLEKILSDEGFTSEIRGCYENPGNPNIMVVKFNGTQPGMKEAERLHNFFAENKRGRTELGQIDPEVVCCNVVDKKPENERNLVNLREHDREPVEKTNNEQLTSKFDEVGIEDDNEPLNKTKVDQQLLDMTVNDQGLVVEVHNDQKPVDDPQNHQEPLNKAQYDQNPAGKARVDQKPVDSINVDQELVIKGNDEQALVTEADDDSVPLVRSSDDLVLTNKTKGDQVPSNKVEYAQWFDGIIENDLEPSNTVEYAQERDGESENDEKPVEKTEGTLYGYLGIIQDLSRLHNGLKRHHVARSRKEIHASSNALM